MSKPAAAAPVMALLITASVARADYAPSAEEGYRFIERSVVLDRSSLPGHVTASLASRCGRFWDVSDWHEPEPIPNDDSCEARLDLEATDGGAPIASRRLKLPPLQQVSVAFDPRVGVQAHYRVTVAEGKGELEAFEHVFFDESGTAICRRPPLTAQVDPCEPVPPEPAYRVYAPLGGGLLLVLGIGVLAYRLRRRRAVPR